MARLVNGAGEPALEAVAGGVVGPDTFQPSGQAPQARAAHQQLHLVVTDHGAAAEGEPRIDPPATVELAGLDMVRVVRSVEIACRTERSDGLLLR